MAEMLGRCTDGGSPERDTTRDGEGEQEVERGTAWVRGTLWAAAAKEGVLMSDLGLEGVTVSAVQWMAARDVLGGEASHFTPWLAANLDILADALGLAELTLVETESSAAGNRLDILATGIDDDGDGRPVAIENQYGISDHRHLGQLVAYLAQQGSGLGVWVVEDYSEAHLAAMEFLNRTSTADVGYMLVRVRFTHGLGPNTYQVHFEVAARPNDFVRRGRRRSSGAEVTGHINEQQRGYLREVLEAASPELEGMGLRAQSMHARGAYVNVQLPASVEVSNWGVLTLRTTRSAASVRLHMIGFETREQNSAALEVLRDRYAERLIEVLPGAPQIDWHGGASGALSDYAGIELAGEGYVGGSADRAASWAVAVCRGWLDVMRADPIADLSSLVEDWVVHHEDGSTDFDDNGEP